MLKEKMEAVQKQFNDKILVKKKEHTALMEHVKREWAALKKKYGD